MSAKYIKDALKTESQDMKPVQERIGTETNVRLIHAALGLGTETAEIQDALKKHIFYGKPLDKVNLAEEMGDVFWYLAILADELGVSFEETMEKNIAKLKKRYGEKFTEDKAIHRDVVAERKILEG